MMSALRLHDALLHHHEHARHAQVEGKLKK